METCIRCGDKGQDRRNLWMACLYQMDELEVPFTQVGILGQSRKMLKERLPSKFFPEGIEQFEEHDSEIDDHLFKFFTLRVCKDCRAEWMQAIEDWFLKSNKPVNPDANIPVRVNGATIMMTEEEYSEVKGNK